MNIWKNASLRFKVLAGLALTLVLFFISFAIIFTQFQTINSQSSHMEETSVQAIDAVDAASLFREKYIFALDMMRDEDAVPEDYEELSSQLDERLERMSGYLLTEEEEDMHETLVFLNQQFDNRVDELISVGLTPDDSIMNQLGSMRDQTVEVASDLENILTNRVENAGNEVTSAIDQAIITSIVSFIAATILGITLFMLLTAGIKRSLNKILKTTARISQGELTVGKLDDSPKDEFGQLNHQINDMSENLRSLVSDISTTSQSVSASSEELAASAEEVNAGAEQVAYDLQNMTDGQQELHTSIQRSAETFRHMEQELKGVEKASSDIAAATAIAEEKTANGQERVSATQETMGRIKTANENNVQVIEELGSESNKIYDIIHLIQDISAQTTLLALNASIEAARAGEAGKGFAVVADEIRKLAAQSEEATHSISETIERISGKVEMSVNQAKNNSTLVHNGENEMKETALAFKDIADSIAQMTGQTNEIHQLVDGVNKRSRYIMEAVTQVEETAVQSANTSENIASTTEEQTATMDSITQSAQEMANIANDLQKKVDSFKL
ncbi:methyl-accepting chemotaxis protein [Salsuginibacillus kocurii]|uniref:methyl-accepting chemotaxis protein n=1 Tax=Salsuginibacillus kocurii TaxID=427078 RepID=UPI0003680D79|nr:methyl-accepting chemotaxis protein [Salsuginibacillus kocurii]